MARKKDEDDWFEDDEAEAKEKPKKKGKKGKKSWKIAAWIAAFIIILAILLLIRFKYSAPAPEEQVAEETAPADEVEEQYVTEPETTGTTEEEGVEYQEPKYLGPDVVPKEDLPNVESNIDTNAEPELFSNMRCEYDAELDILYMSLRIYNNLGEDVKISPRGVQKGYNTYFLIRGVVDTDPGCGTELVQPGEYTDCKRIGFDLPRYSNQPGINRISVQVPGITEALLIECPKVPEESAINQWINKIEV